MEQVKVGMRIRELSKFVPVCISDYNSIACSKPCRSHHLLFLGLGPI